MVRVIDEEQAQLQLYPCKQVVISGLIQTHIMYYPLQLRVIIRKVIIN
jgi:hypothetical protein